MSGSLPPIPPPLGTSTGSPSNPNVKRVDSMPTNDTTNTTTTTNVSQNVSDENLPQLLDNRGGSHVINVPAFDKDDFTSQKGPSDTRDTKIATLRLKFNTFKALEGEKVNGTFTRLKILLNDLENNGITIPQAEVNDTYKEGLDSNSDVEEDQRSSNEFMADLNAEYHERALLVNQKRFYKRFGRVGTARKPIDKSKEACFSHGKLGHFQKDYPSNKTSTPSYPSPNTPFNKPRPYTLSFPQTSLQNTLKDEIAALTQRLDDLTKSTNEKGKIDKGKKDVGTTKIKAFMAIPEDEPSVGKANERSGQWVDITMKKTCSKVTLNQLLSKQVPGNIVKALGGKGRIKENNSSKEVVFTKSDESSFEPAPEFTSDSEADCDIQDPLPPLPKLIEENPLSKKPSDRVSQTYVIKKKTEPKLPVVQISCFDKKADSFIEQLLLTLMEEVKAAPSLQNKRPGMDLVNTKHYRLKNNLSVDCYSKPKCSTCGSNNHLTKDHTEKAVVKNTLKKLTAQSPLKPTPKKNLRVSKSFIEYKYCGSNNHHLDVCEFYPGCEICWSIAHEIADCPKNLKTTGHQRLLTSNLLNPLKSGFTKGTNLCENVRGGLPKEESGPKVVFGDNSSGETKGYSSVNYNGMTFTRVAYVNGLKHNLISISQLSERRNMTLIEATRTMLNSDSLPKQFWGEAINAACYTQNRSIIVKRHRKIAYEVFRGRAPDISYFHVFGCPMHIHNHKDHLGKFDEKANDGFFLGYYLAAKAFRVCNVRRQEMEETFMLPSVKMMKPYHKPAQRVMLLTSMK
ncbi:retrovirus-related pol polyprotein from transposon TNT 1-94 [Tanacetum coccineum]